MFDYLLYTSLAVFLLGLIYKISTWFTRKIGIAGKDITAAQRLLSVVKGITGVVFSTKILALLEAVALDVLLQRRILKESVSRWLAHMLIFYGFTLLLLMHALESVISEAIFNEYYSTVNPFFFLRDFFGAMVLAGVLLAALRRYIAKPRRLRSGGMDHYTIIIVAVVMLSGIALEGVKITSHSEFMRMVEDYAGLDDEDEIEALETLWAKEYGTVSPTITAPFDAELLEAGREVHESSCQDCHAPAPYAFTGFAAANLIKPIALWLDEHDGVTLLWYVHVIACFIGLAYLPFSKMFHVFAAPVSLISNRVMQPDKSLPANIATRQIMELDACTHCGSCSLGCSAAMMFEAIGNEYILPSEKITLLKRLAAGKKLDDEQLRAIQEGVYFCTNCDRCTVRCPSGIRLKELWYSVREKLLAEGPPLPLVLSPFSFARGLILQQTLATDSYSSPIDKARQAVSGRFVNLTNPDTPIPLNKHNPGASHPAVTDRTYTHCFSCQSCTTVCPVVANYENPEQVLGLLPHQIMCSLGLGLSDMAAGAGMIWDCLTCYKCQENCPQQVQVCDILWRLKNHAVQSIEH
ncbi:MAG: 4Fe-4S dicluster domain-containing protein [Deltaproteobacteria bacterium]|jgi:heterodisulfide reductase subunit C|nr:4Fe-4S dicluster domain-containing protein [Deltaproteobacteria bacterium]